MSHPVLRRLTMGVAENGDILYWIAFSTTPVKEATFKHIEPEHALLAAQTYAPIKPMWWQVKLTICKQNKLPMVRLYRDWGGQWVPQILLPTDEAFDAWLQYARMLYSKRRV